MEFKILRIDSENKKIGLSARAVGKDEPVIDTKIYSSEAGSGMASLGELADFGLSRAEPKSEPETKAKAEGEAKPQPQPELEEEPKPELTLEEEPKPELTPEAEPKPELETEEEPKAAEKSSSES